MIFSFSQCKELADLHCTKELQHFRRREIKEWYITYPLQTFADNAKISAWLQEEKKTPLDIMKALFDYSVIGCVDKDGNWLFKYKDEMLEYMSSHPYYCVHYGFCDKLHLPNSHKSLS